MRDEFVRGALFREVGQGHPPTREDGGTASEAFQAIAVEGAYACEPVVMCRTARIIVAHFRMRCAMDAAAIDDEANTDPGAHGHVGQRPGRTVGPSLGERGGIDVGFHRERDAQTVRQRACEVEPAPSRLGRRQNMAVICAISIETDRTERRQPQRRQRRLRGEPGECLGRRFVRGTGGDRMGRGDRFRSLADREHAFRPACLDPANHCAPTSPTGPTVSPSKASCRRGAGAPTKPCSPGSSTKLATTPSALTNQL